MDIEYNYKLGTDKTRITQFLVDPNTVVTDAMVLKQLTKINKLSYQRIGIIEIIVKMVPNGILQKGVLVFDKNPQLRI